MALLVFVAVLLCILASSKAEIVSIRPGKDVNVNNTNDLISILTRKDCTKYHCKGADCRLVIEANGCQTCICPLGSIGRGCDQMPESLWSDLFDNGCPDDFNNTIVRSPSQGVLRWHRLIDRPKGIDECRSYIFPYCDNLDFNLWRSPRTPAECFKYCFSKREHRKFGFVYSSNN